MTPEIFIKRQLAVAKVSKLDVIQTLWSGYGEVARYQPIDHTGKRLSPVVIKHCQPPKNITHPKGWHSEHAHQRKLTSYAVEQYWYRDWSEKVGSLARVANCYGDYFDSNSGQRIVLLEDLDAAGFNQAYQADNLPQLLDCIDWLARFHATFIQDLASHTWPENLWQYGTYWHLSTRQQEYKLMAASAVKTMAPLLTERLDKTRFRTLVHGDAKVANFCFAPNTSISHHNVAAVDFQYVGGGVGVQDLVYLLGSALSETELLAHLAYCQEHYFAELGRELLAQGQDQAFAHDVIKEWQDLFLIAWADFQRFLLGWSPEHHKNTALSQKLTQQALAQLTT